VTVTDVGGGALDALGYLATSDPRLFLDVCTSHMRLNKVGDALRLLDAFRRKAFAARTSDTALAWRN
jgi:hypothetical protein